MVMDAFSALYNAVYRIMQYTATFVSSHNGNKSTVVFIYI